MAALSTPLSMSQAAIDPISFLKGLKDLVSMVSSRHFAREA
jgi:hypothetical protein